jgi:Glycosyl transferase family 2
VSLSVVIRSKDEADRLRLTLASLARQTVAAEVVVVDDGSNDHTPAVLDEASRALRLVVVRHETARGRSAASNAGAAAASGEVLLFLDGDTLGAPTLVERHLAAHAGRDDLIGRGENYHLRCTRFLLDPETGAARPGEEARLARMPADERAALRVTRQQVRDDFASIARRAEPSIYPGAGPRRLAELEMQALREHHDCGVLWAAAAGQNQSVSRWRFLASGGFDEGLDLNEHRELAFRLCAAGARMTAVAGAASYHLTHRTGWRDPLRDMSWERRFYDAHPVTAVKLLSVFWASLGPTKAIAPEARIASLPALEAAARGETGIDYDAVRATLGLPTLGRQAAAATVGSAV